MATYHDSGAFLQKRSAVCLMIMASMGLQSARCGSFCVLKASVEPNFEYKSGRACKVCKVHGGKEDKR